MVKTHFQKINSIISITTLFLYTLYSPFNDNDVNGLYKKINCLDIPSIYATDKTRDNLIAFNKFTDNEFKNKSKIIPINSELNQSKYLISRVAKKIKRNVTSEEELLTQNLIQSNKIKKIDCVNGYTIYEILE